MIGVCMIRYLYMCICNIRCVIVIITYSVIIKLVYYLIIIPLTIIIHLNVKQRHHNNLKLILSQTLETLYKKLSVTWLRLN